MRGAPSNRALRTGVAALLCDVADGLAHEYSGERADTGFHCHCGMPAERMVPLDWEFEYLVSREVGATQIALFIGLGVISWKNNTLESSFSTFHAACPGCAETDFAPKRAFAQALEPVPEYFRRKKLTTYPHLPVGPDGRRVSRFPVPPPAEEEPPEYFLIMNGTEKGPFTVMRLRELLDLGRIDRSARVRLDGQADSTGLAQVLGPAG